MPKRSAVLTVIITYSVSLAAPADVQTIRPGKAGMRITESVRIIPGVYELPAEGGGAAITIAGNDLVVDFQGATLVGAPEDTDPDAFVGRGLAIEGHNVTIKNANIRGYRVGIFAENSPGLTITGCDVSRNYRQRLKSTVEREDLSDWLYGHENDDNEWLRYGAGIYLLNCPDATVAECRASNGQNGLCLVKCDRARVVDNNMSFMSGWGLAMWRSSKCEIFNNKFDWCMRGYSHGVYSRGQDSAGILVYEQCHDNLFANNSATHGGDGFFLYAGNETVNRTGKGGCSGNILYRNDFSHAAANGIEATFSKGNVFIENTLDECAHGVWAGYSYETIIENNAIRNCTYGVSIEHGRDNRIAGNDIEDTDVGVNLWSDHDKDLLASAFGRAHDRCPSKSNKVIANRFERVKTAVRLVDDTGSTVAGNAMKQVDTSVQLKGDVGGLTLGLTEDQRATLKNEGTGSISFDAGETARWVPLDIVAREPRLATRKGSQDTTLSPPGRRGRKFIFVDEWGPYDFTDVRIHPSKVHGGPRATVQVLGVDSSFRVAKVTGDVKVTPITGRLPDKLSIDATEPGLHGFTVDIDAEGRTLRVTGTLLSTTWRVRFYGWSEAVDPREDADNWRQITAAAPLDELTVSDLDFLWYWRGPSDKVPADHFATIATATVTLPAGTWRLQTMSDDGVRVFVDDREVISNWTHHGPTPDEAQVEIEAGPHDIRVEHFEIDGFAQLQLRIGE